MWYEEKMLFTSIFSPLITWYPDGLHFMVVQAQDFLERVTSFNPLPDVKILDWSKLKKSPDDILKFIYNEK